MKTALIALAMASVYGADQEMKPCVAKCKKMCAKAEDPTKCFWGCAKKSDCKPDDKPKPCVMACKKACAGEKTKEGAMKCFKECAAINAVVTNHQVTKSAPWDAWRSPRNKKIQRSGPPGASRNSVTKKRKNNKLKMSTKSAPWAA